MTMSILERQEMAEKLIDFGNWLILSDCCRWDNLDQIPMDLWEMDEDEEYHGDVCHVIEHANTALRQFTAGIRYNPHAILDTIGDEFTTEVELLKEQFGEYLDHTNVDLNLRLWSSEFFRSIDTSLLVMSEEKDSIDKKNEEIRKKEADKHQKSLRRLDPKKRRGKR